jgi:hypothetical protein
VYSAIVRLVGLASIVACLIVIASFGMFAVNQTSQASNQQTRTLRGEVPAEASAPTPQKAAKPHKGTVRQTIDDAAEWLTSPFDGLTSGSNSEWANHGIDLGLALVIYGFGIGFLARTLRVRV